MSKGTRSFITVTLPRNLYQIVLLSMIFVPQLALAAGNEVEGFRLGMSMQQVSRLAVEKGYQFSKPTGVSASGAATQAFTG
jgi:hypothetical protein